MRACGEKMICGMALTYVRDQYNAYYKRKGYTDGDIKSRGSEEVSGWNVPSKYLVYGDHFTGKSLSPQFFSHGSPSRRTVFSNYANQLVDIDALTCSDDQNLLALKVIEFEFFNFQYLPGGTPVNLLLLS